MRKPFVFLLLTPLAWLGGCAAPVAPAPMALACDYAQVPAGAVFGTTEGGLEIATYPPTVPDNGCQRVWHGQRAQPGEMHVMATYHYRGGRVQRLEGRVPGGPEYACRYRMGRLDERASRRPDLCPSAEQVERRRY